jgi:phosphoribosylformylglycinamidine cyclo-ligase
MRAELGSAIHAAAHITGGGILGNVVRILPEGLNANIDMDTFETPEIFFAIQRRGQVIADEMVRVFNCGLGMVVSVDSSSASAALTIARAQGIVATVVGNVSVGSQKVVLS